MCFSVFLLNLMRRRAAEPLVQIRKCFHVGTVGKPGPGTPALLFSLGLCGRNWWTNVPSFRIFQVPTQHEGHVPERTPFTTFTTTNFDLNLVWTAHKASCPGLCSGATIGTWFSVEHRFHSPERDTIFVYICMISAANMVKLPQTVPMMIHPLHMVKRRCL